MKPLQTLIKPARLWLKACIYRPPLYTNICRFGSCYTRTENAGNGLLRASEPFLQTRISVGCVRLFNSTTELFAPPIANSIQKNVQAVIAKRPAKKKVAVSRSRDKDQVYEVTAYATSEEYHLEDLSTALEQQGLYLVSSLPEDVENALYVCAKYKVDETQREVFFFREGCAVFWNMPETERAEVLKFVEKFSENVYSVSLIEHELEKMDFVYTQKAPSLTSGTIHIQERQDVDTEESSAQTTLVKYAFSNALSLSVKLGIWEASLDKFVESIEPVLEDMKVGRRIKMTKQEVLQKTGELFTLRHLINLSSDLLDPPDFYWDREQLETLYQQAFVYLNIPKRTKVMNEKLNHCCELTELLISHLNDNHHIRLEWMIILLIMVEVFFEIVHYVEKYTVQEEFSVTSQTANSTER
ncbi:required for meiotic nuclear division protein 1 homolog isoform X2 [Liolophura sinensis]|uniref:required for meiotic nuclear division protein 1 homolog isoform X2 n=1 Tax=Liolophura sinensis TaxID=3198878 RepID=UPI0031594215